MKGLGVRSAIGRVAIGMGLLALAGCAFTQVSDVAVETRGERFPRPDEVLVYDFANSHDDVTLDHSAVKKLVNELSKSEQPQLPDEVVTAVTNELSERLVEKIRKLGMLARRERGVPPAGNFAVVHGQFTDIDEGNETERIVIGLGVGASDVRTHVQVYRTEADLRLLEQFDTVAESTLKPGMLETVGAGAIGGRAAVSAAVSTGVSGASEKWRDNVEADAERTADKIAGQLAQLFLDQGWVTAEQVEQATSKNPLNQ